MTGAAAALDTTKFKSQVLANSPQLNHNCSAELVYSGRDAKTGKVKSYALTAGHCVADIPKDKANVLDFPRWENGKVIGTDTYFAIVVSTHYKYDLALLKLSDTTTYFDNSVKLAPADAIPDMGSDVYTVGYPFGWVQTVTGGLFGSRVDSPIPDKTNIEYFTATPPIAGGNSGGALYRQNGAGDFELLGVSDMVRQGNPQSGIYVPVDQIHEFLTYADPDVWPAPKKDMVTGGH